MFRMTPAARQVVIVAGAPGSGKTTLAGPLAAELGFALLAKDRIKETLHDILGSTRADLAWSTRLGAAAMELLWALAADAPAVVLEANFRPDDERNPRRIRALSDRPVVVSCMCPIAVAMDRYANRRVSRHPIHTETLRNPGPDYFAQWNRPMGIGELIAVDTTLPVDVCDLAVEVRAKLAASGSGG
jgi:predicted kinase